MSVLKTEETAKNNKRYHGRFQTVSEGGFVMEYNKITEEARLQEKMSEKAYETAKSSYNAIEDTVVNGYKAVENAVTGAYKAVEDTVTGGYQKIEDAFVEKFLTRDGETVQEAKARLNSDLSA